jgi:hypothetical protein
MKKYLVVACIALGGVLVSCSNDDNEVLSTPKVTYLRKRNSPFSF